MNVLSDIFKDLNKDISWLPEKTIFLTVYGSIAYGLNSPESDIDIRGTCSVPKNYLYGFNKNFEQYIRAEPDCTIFNLRKFFNLTAQNNPNSLEMLYTDEEHHILVTDFGKLLLENRDHFLSKQLKERYIGYSKAQAHKISGHRRFLLSPAKEPPTRKEIGLPEKPQIEKNQFDVIKNLINKKLEEWNPHFEPFSDSQKIYLQGKVSEILTEIQITINDKWCAAARTIGIDENLLEIIRKEKEYENKLDDWKSYLNWKKNRNPKRAKLEEKCGFDAKHACQLIRLLIVGKEILETKKVNVKRTHDREMLMDIKNGNWKYEKIIELADKIEAEVKISYANSTLPNQPNIPLLDNLCIEIMERSLCA